MNKFLFVSVFYNNYSIFEIQKKFLDKNIKPYFDYEYIVINNAPTEELKFECRQLCSKLGYISLEILDYIKERFEEFKNSLPEPWSTNPVSYNHAWMLNYGTNHHVVKSRAFDYIWTIDPDFFPLKPLSERIINEINSKGYWGITRKAHPEDLPYPFIGSLIMSSKFFINSWFNCTPCFFVNSNKITTWYDTGASMWLNPLIGKSSFIESDNGYEYFDSKCQVKWGDLVSESEEKFEWDYSNTSENFNNEFFHVDQVSDCLNYKGNKTKMKLVTEYLNKYLD